LEIAKDVVAKIKETISQQLRSLDIHGDIKINEIKQYLVYAEKFIDQIQRRVVQYHTTKKYFLFLKSILNGSVKEKPVFHNNSA